MTAANNNLDFAKMALNFGGSGILITDNQDTIVQVNPAFCRISGYKPEEIIGRKPFLLRSGEHDESFYNRIWKTLEQEKFWQGEICYHNRSGNRFYVWETISAVSDEQGNVTHYVSNMADINEIKQQQRKLAEATHFDSLTQLPNKHYFEANLAQALEMSKRENSRVALLFINLDDFSPINEKYGFKSGDMVLTQIAKRISKTIRKADTAARISADEFVVLAPKITAPNLLQKITHRLIENISKPIQLTPELELSVNASIGVSIYPDDLQNLSQKFQHLASNDKEIVELADQAMYAAKEHDDSVCFFSQINQDNFDAQKSEQFVQRN